MRINLSTEKLAEYKSQNANVIKDIGFAQKGYKSILRYDTWRQQMCTLSATKVSSEYVKDACFSAGAWIDISELKAYVDIIVANGATHIYMTGSYDDYDGVTEISIDATKEVDVNRSESEFYSAYDRYVESIDKENIKTWTAYKFDRDQAEKAEFDELQRFMDAKKVYENLKHKFE